MPRITRAKGAVLVAAGAILLLTLAPSLDAGTIRGHGTGGRHQGGGGHHHGGYHGGYHYAHYPYYYPYYSPYYYGYPYGLGLSFAYYGPGYGYGYGAPSYGYGAQAAFIDTDVSPEDAHVYLDGEYVGTADDFDGYPTFLPVEPGKHELTFKMDGFHSVTKRINAAAGTIVSFDFRMPEGKGEIGGQGSGQPEVSDPQGAESDVALEADEAEVEAGPGFLVLKVSPPDASVYLDGEFLGSAAQVSKLHGSLRLESGQHRIEVVRPGHEATSREIVIKAGERLNLSIDLKESGD